MGYQRGGWYSYDWLERAVGIGDFADGCSARRILPDLKPLAPGDTRGGPSQGTNTGSEFHTIQPRDVL